MIIRLAAASAALAIFSNSVIAEEAKQPTSAAPKEKLICKKVHQLGTLLPKRTCATKEQWDQMEVDGKKAIDQIQRSPNYVPTG